MKISYDDHTTLTVLTLSGELINDQAEALRRTCLDRFATGIRDIVLDLENLTLIDSAGLETLLWLQDEIKSHLGQLRLVRADETIRTILRVTRLECSFDLYDTIESAAKSLRFKS